MALNTQINLITNMGLEACGQKAEDILICLEIGFPKINPSKTSVTCVGERTADPAVISVFYNSD
jgi:hypothetical protein